jgi:hypothetical protein
MRAALIAGCLLLQACASTYRGPDPDFSLTGAAAVAEAGKFELDETIHLEGRGSWFEMGPKKDWYTVSSLRPMIARVSPEAESTISRARKWRVAEYAAVLVGAAALTVAALDDDRRTANPVCVVGLMTLGAAAGFNWKYGSLLSTAASEFNHDMRHRFTPALSFNYTF